MTSATRHTLHVPDMSCGHCTSTIEAAVSALPDVNQVATDLDAKTVTVAGGDPATIAATIQDAGYTVHAAD